MRIGLIRFSWLAALAAGWGLTWTCAAVAQDKGPRPLGGVVAKKDGVKSPEDAANRMVEIQTELAWLADPVTFPYFLEAKVSGARLEVRGFVPNKAIGEHALRLARLNSPFPVVDATREHSSLLVRTTRIEPDKLRASVATALRQALPTGYKNLRVECGGDGKVVVGGNVYSFEERLAVSQSLRRLHGCGYVINLTQVPTGTLPARDDVATITPPPAKMPVAKAPAKKPKTPAPRPQTLPRERPADIQPVQAKESGKGIAPPPAEPEKADGPFGGFFRKLFGKKTNPPPRDPVKMGRDPGKLAKDLGKITPDPLPKIARPLPRGPEKAPPKTDGKTGSGYESEGIVILPGPGPEPGPAPAKTITKVKALTPPQVKTRLESLFPKARPIVVTPEGGQKLKIEMTARTQEESNTIAGRVLGLPELEPYEVNLFIRIDAPPMK
jgi:hypothetical protein